MDVSRSKSESVRPIDDGSPAEIEAFNKRVIDEPNFMIICRLSEKPKVELLEDRVVDGLIKLRILLDFNDKTEEDVDDFIKNLDNYWKVIKREHCFYTPIHLAAKKGYLELVKSLVKEGSDVNYTLTDIRNSETPLESAIRGDNVEIVKYLIDNGANFEPNEIYDPLEFLLLVHAFRFRSSNVINAYLNESTDITYVSKTYGSLINCAVYNGDLDLIERVLDYGAYISSSHVDTKHYSWFHGPLTPLQTAIALKRLDIVKLLIRKGANVDFTASGYGKCTALQYALDTNAKDDIIVALLDAGVAVNYIDNYYILSFDYQHKHPSFNNLLKRLAIKLDVAGFNVCNTNKLKRVVNEKKLAGFRDLCCKEIDRMTNTETEISGVTYYDLLTKSVHELVINAQYDVIESFISRREFGNQFPLYGGVMMARLRNAVERRKYIPKFEKFMAKIFPGAPIDLIKDLTKYVREEVLTAFMMEGQYAFEKIFNLRNRSNF